MAIAVDVVALAVFPAKIARDPQYELAMMKQLIALSLEKRSFSSVLI